MIDYNCKGHMKILMLMISETIAARLIWIQNLPTQGTVVVGMKTTDIIE